jgi:ABC-type phosphate transport system substrate-binding protein
MTSLSARRIVPACILSAAAVAALVAPGAASAGTIGEQCSGANITGKGSSLQKLAQQTVWDPGFNTSANARGCNGTQGSKGKPTVTYESVGSGAGMEAWGINGHAFEGSNGYVGTDEPPNSTQIAEIESHKLKAKAESTLETIPVLQGAVAIIVRLPKFCSGASNAYKGRLVLDNVTLEAIWHGTITKWNEITDDGDHLAGANCTAAQQESKIIRVVRKDQSGTTSIFKKYLALINGGKVFGELGWREISEGLPNVEDWPGEVTRPAGTGGGELVKKVAETFGSIGYANLADAQSNGSFTSPNGGAGLNRFWVPIQNNGVEQKEETYADPSTNNEGVELSNANCTNTEYTNGETPFPPASTLEPWNEVTTRTSETHYTLCGLSYDLTFHEYSKYPGTSLNEATTVNNFLRYVLAIGGGQALLNKHDYLALPSALEVEGREGAEKTKF